MKKILFISAMLISVGVSAQFGIKGGLTVTKLVTQPGVISRISPGYSLGIFYSMGITDRLFFQPELILSKRTYVPFNISSKSYAYVYNAQEKFNTLEIPLLFRYMLQDGGMPYIIGGVTPNVLLSSPYFGINYAVTGGVGLNIPVANNFIILEARFSRDLYAAFGNKYNSLSVMTGFMF